MTYSTTSETTKQVCEKIGFDFDIEFVSTMKRGEKIFVKGTCGKQHEFQLLKKACGQFGFCYKGVTK